MKKINNVLIYQMGKVASTTIYNSIVATEKFNVSHIHTLNKERINNHFDWCEKNNRKPYGHFVESLEVKRDLSENKLTKVISLVREPIARNMSAYFQNMDDIFLTNDSFSKYKMNELIDRFMEQYAHNIPSVWFDNEFKKYLNIDVYKKKFDRKLGFQTYKNNNVEALVIRVDVDNITKQRIISEFLDVEIEILSNKNLASTKSYSKTYTDFINTVKLPVTYVDNQLSSKFCKYFFNVDMIEKFRAKYLLKTLDN